MSETKGYGGYEEDATKLIPEREPTSEELKEQRKREKYAMALDKLDPDLLLKNIEEELNSKMFDIAENNFKALGEDFYVPTEVVDEFLNKIKEVGKELLLANELTDEQLKSIFGEDVSALKKYDMFQGNIKYFIPLYYIKKLCPDNFVVTMDSVMNIILGFDDTVSKGGCMLNTKMKNSEEAYTYLYGFIEKYGSRSAEMLNYFVAHDGTYLSDSTAILFNALNDTNNQNSSQEHEGIRELSDSEGIHIRVDNSGEVQVSHREQENSNNQAMLRYYESMGSAIQFYESFIFEPEGVNLYEYLKDNPVKLSNLGGKVIKDIDLSTEKGINFCFHGILSMVKTRGDIDFPVYKENMSEEEKGEWKKQWDRIIKEYENVLRSYISQDFTTNERGERVEKPRNETFDKVFYLSSHGDQVIDRFHFSTDVVQGLTSKPISDYSYVKTGDEEKDKDDVWNKGEQFGDELRTYIKEHPNDKILVCISEHGKPDGSSSNDMTKDDWLYLANMSSNINIWSIRCFFGTAFESDQIANQKSSVSGYSNNSPTWGPVTEVINDAAELGLGYHEMEIYSRLKYLTSVSPLTESMSYMNWNTGKTEIGKIGLAQNDGNNGNTDSLDVA